MKKTIFFLALCMMLVTGFLTLLVLNDPVKLISVLELWSLIFFWVFLCGSLMYFLRNTFTKYYSRIRLPIWIKFTVFSTTFALIEEAIAVSINNYFYQSGVHGLTASTNYWEVISKHSIIALLPVFLIFSFYIQKFKPSPYKAFLYFGVIGTLAETTIGGFLSLLQFGMWIFVYGLMIYLPAHQNNEFSQKDFL